MLTNVVSFTVFYLNAYNFHLQYSYKTKYLQMVLQVCLWFLTNLYMIRTAFREPGIIPVTRDRDISAKDFGRYTSDPINFKNNKFEPVRMSNNFLYINNKKVFYMVQDSRQTIFKQMRYCDICNVFRPPTRCSHCYNCELCIIGFDHHCVWLGTCIGARNYFCFILFLLSLTC